MKKLLILYIFFTSVFLGFANEETKTNFNLFANLSLNGVIYQSDFNELPGYRSCCSNFSSAFGLKPGFLVGMEYKIDILGINSKYGFGLGLQNLSADYNNDELIGYDIVDNTATEIISEFRLYPSIQNIVTRHHLALGVLDFIGTDLILGFRVGFPIVMSFEQEEYLKSPDDLVFETGTDKRDIHSADIPDKSTMHFALDLGFRHKGFPIGDFIIQPELVYSHSLTDFSSSVDWKGHNIALGINIVYEIPKAKAIPPLPAPNPKLPLPEPPPEPEPAKLDFALYVSHEGKIINNNGKLDYKVYLDTEVFKVPIMPILYFNKGDSEPIELPSKLKEMFGFKTSSTIISQLAQILKNNDASVKLKPTVFGEDEEPIAEKRIENIKKYLLSQGIEANKIDIIPTTIIQDEMKYSELENESHRVDIILESTGFNVTSRTENMTKEAIPLKIKSDITAEAKPYVYDLSVIKDGEIVKRSNSEDMTYMIELEGLQQGISKYVISSKVIDAENKEFTDEIGFDFNYILEERVSENKLVDKDQSMFLLGYFAFDSSVFTMINEDAKNKVKEAISSGLTIELIPLTDELGTREYNESLAQRRAGSALRLLKLTTDNVEINYDIRHIFPNDNPYGRIMNRAVWVKIK